MQARADITSDAPSRAATPGGAGRPVLRALGHVTRFAWKTALVAAFVAGGIALGGFLSFARNVTTSVPQGNVDDAPAITVLTGGPARIETALDLLAANPATTTAIAPAPVAAPRPATAADAPAQVAAAGKPAPAPRRLLITGVNPRTSQATLIRNNGAHAALFGCCVDIGYEAADTVGNAAEAAQWTRRMGYDALVVVTADYHMPRSMLEFRRAMPGVRLIAHPVPTPMLREAGFYRNPRAVRRLLGEWVKYLSALTRGWLGTGWIEGVLITRD